MNDQSKSSTIMYTAIDGYSPLLSEDKQKAISLIEKVRNIVRPLVDKHNGEWYKDTLSSFFNPVDAVNCALEIQKKLKIEPDINLRIRIHVANSLFGAADGVKVASGIGELAEPGGICISEQVYYAVRNKLDIETEFLGEKTMENINRPIKVYAVKLSEESEVIAESVEERSKLSIAVLPFRDMSADKDQNYFCEGMAEEIINKLTQIEDIKVIARTSSFFFKGKDVNITDIGEKLDVKWVLEGSVRKAGNKIRVTAQLINVVDQTHIFSNNYDRDLEDIFAIQDEISIAIVDKLKGTLLKEEKKSIQKRYTSNTEAYQFYLMGTHLAFRFDQENAVHFLQKALEKDPTFPLPYVSLSSTYSNMAYQTEKSAIEVMPLMKEVAQKALSLDNTLAEAYAAMCLVNWVYDWDWNAADYHIQKALELNSASALVQIGNVVYQEKLGRSEITEQSLKRALELDPLSVGINAIALDYYRRERRIEDADKIYQKMQQIDPNARRIYMFYGKMYCELGEYEKALQILNKEKEIAGEFVWLDETLGYTYACAGMRQQAQNILNKLIGQREKQYVKPTAIAFVYMGLGDLENTFIWLEKGIDERDPHMTHLYVYPEWDPIRSDPRYKVLLKRMNLPEY